MSNGGADVLCGGEGDDILAISDATVARLKGGTGTDTLRFDRAGVTLDLTALSDLTIEEIDLQVGVGSHDLTLDLQEVLNISDSSNTLTTLGGGRLSLPGPLVGPAIAPAGSQTALRALPEHHGDTAGHPLAGDPLSDHRHPEQRHSG